jgi:hypothetical protein
MNRYKLSDRIGRETDAIPVSFRVRRQIVEGRDMIVFRNLAGGIAFMVNSEDLCDAAGNEFEIDLEIA